MLYKLPFELIELIVSFLSFQDLFDLALTNLFFFHLISYKISPKLTNIPKKLQSASRLGNLSFLRFASLAFPTQFTKTIQRDPWPLNFSIEYNNPRVISFLLSHNAKVGIHALNQACLYEEVNLVKTLVNTHHALPNNKTLEICTKVGSTTLVSFFIHQGELFTTHTLKIAASMGHLHLVKLLINNNVPANHHVTNVALINNHNNIVKFLTEHGYHPSSARTLKLKLKNYTNFYK